MVDDRRQDGGRPPPSLRVDGLAALHHTPAVVSAAHHPIDHLPELPADIPYPEVSAPRIEAHLPGIAKAVRPHLGTEVVTNGKGVVGRNSVEPAAGRSVDVDPEDGREQITVVLPGVMDIRRIRSRAVARGDEEVAVRTKLQTAPVVTSRQPVDHDTLALRLGARWIVSIHGKARHPG